MSLLVLFQLRQSLVVIDFAVHRDFIAKTLCIEKDVEGSTCNGRCHLKKELEKVEQSEGTPENVPIHWNFEEVHFITDHISTSPLQDGPSNSRLAIIARQGDLMDGYRDLHYPPPE